MEGASHGLKAWLLTNAVVRTLTILFTIKFLLPVNL